ncbi:MAG TPA: UDP-N-acetylmuramoyl-tripeptide--D-alanyl-D-alanine ligase, partial [Mobilitalea sp.]|nr:UDP-N-acetylmuramoyl-tripeptide--D-alanyl-D-alanine ligase [Mobilitalea sp.]
MKNMTLSNIAKACNGKLFCDESYSSCEVSGVVLDSRRVEKDYLFIATVGERVDGHSFIDSVFENGALAVLCERAPLSPKGPYILVKNSFTALADIARWYRSQLNIKVVGITGSVGKTSTKEFISSVLATKYKVLKTEGNHNNEVGLPLTILKLSTEHEIAVLEMGISDFGEMHRLSSIAKPDICVITNIGQCHLENLKSRQGVLQAKSEIFDYMSD